MSKPGGRTSDQPLTSLPIARAQFGSLEVVKGNKCLAPLALKRFSTIAFHLAALMKGIAPKSAYNRGIVSPPYGPPDAPPRRPAHRLPDPAAVSAIPGSGGGPAGLVHGRPGGARLRANRDGQDAHRRGGAV